MCRDIILKIRYSNFYPRGGRVLPEHLVLGRERKANNLWSDFIQINKEFLKKTKKMIVKFLRTTGYIYRQVA